MLQKITSEFIWESEPFPKFVRYPIVFSVKFNNHVAKADILVSERGKKGGFKLNKKPEDITLYDIVYAVEGEIVINECLLDSEFLQDFIPVVKYMLY